MEMTSGLAMYGLSVLLLFWFGTSRLPAWMARLLNAELGAGIACALLTVSLVLGLLLVYFGTQALLGTAFSAGAAVSAVVIATFVLAQVFTGTKQPV
ncbi:MAG: hypothetical protein R3D65_15750 [Zhengella sp.]|uniref:hypothetical protein n=1 Tax=Zhengella sp. TaxID=2282762 RepID=UPI001DEC21DF|nr:hypothetical protein [Notoacmeibacter sp.]MCC0026501.1 hypothetical protein [Brucellaceae bacterium]